MTTLQEQRGLSLNQFPADVTGDTTEPNPVAACTNYIRNHSAVGARPVVVVEGGYFDPRDDSAADRAEHLADSFRLVNDLGRHLTQPTILLAALVNDFGCGRNCGELNCGPAPASNPTDEVTPPLAFLPRWARPAYEGIVPRALPLRTFGMRATRNRAAKHLARLQRCPDEVPIRWINDSEFTDVYADTASGPVYLGRRRHGPYGVKVRCTALMAQHYFDLYRAAAAIRPDMSDLWIVDFNRSIEAARVQAGASTSLAIYQWPSGVRTLIINCVYYPGHPELQPLRVTCWPD